MKRKTLAAAVLAALMLVCGAVCASADETLFEIFHAAEQMLMACPNVTLRGTLDLSVDGEAVKHAELKHVQDGASSFRDVRLVTPRADGTTTESGYVVRACDGDLTVYHRFSGRMEQKFYGDDKDTVLRPNTALHALLGLGRAAAAAADAERYLTTEVGEDGRTDRLLMQGEHVPETVNQALNLALLYLGGRLRGIDYALVPLFVDADIQYYETPVEGLLYCTIDVMVEKADVWVERGSEGEITGAGGTVSARLVMRSGYSHTVTAAFEFAAEKYGESRLPE